MTKKQILTRIANKDNLGVIIAVCAILISAASFYATYLQARAAERQVRAMTMPLLRFTHGNFDEVSKTAYLEFTLKNAGVGPAILQSVVFKYKNQNLSELGDFIRACCAAEAAQYREQIQQLLDAHNDVTQGGSVTSPLHAGVIIPGQDEYNFYGLYAHENSDVLWNKINEERWKLSLDICYCSLLGECFQTLAGTTVEEVKACPVTKHP